MLIGGGGGFCSLFGFGFCLSFLVFFGLVFFFSGVKIKDPIILTSCSDLLTEIAQRLHQTLTLDSNHVRSRSL